MAARFPSLVAFHRSGHRSLLFLLCLSHGWRRVYSSAGAGEDTTSPDTRDHRRRHPTHRLASVADAVNERKLPPELRGRPNAIRSETDIENVVEQRVWRSMVEGQFENLPGKGKPLKLSTNPHVDPAEDALYRILSRNGCAPEWVELNKEIRGMIKTWRATMKKAWSNQSNDGSPNWTEEENRLKAQMSIINGKVDGSLGVLFMSFLLLNSFHAKKKF